MSSETRIIEDEQVRRVLSMFEDKPDTPERQAERKAFLAELGALWDAVPSQRFGQLIMNLSRNEHGVFSDVWEWSLDEWRKKIRGYGEEITRGS